MRILVCGGRSYSDRRLAFSELDRIHAATPIDCVIEGGANGADDIVSKWSASRNVHNHKRYHADWAIHGKAAGPIRNQRMIDEGKPDLVVAFPGGRGTADMVNRAMAAGIEVIEVGRCVEIISR